MTIGTHLIINPYLILVCIYFVVVLVLIICVEDCKIYKVNTNKNGKISKNIKKKFILYYISTIE